MDQAGSAMRDVLLMRRALTLAAQGPLGDPNPRVGAVILDRDGRVAGEGYHRGAGTPHAEGAALAVAGERARGGTCYVTLEPCNHVGRTGACTAALLDAGVARVVVAMADPNPTASGGRLALTRAGVTVETGLLGAESEALNAAWLASVRLGRPFVTWKVASTLDGRIAAADATSQWITGPEARADVHELRATVGAVLVGTGTAFADDPALTVRRPDGEPADRQPLRAVMGLRAEEIPGDARLRDDQAETLVLSTQDPHEALAALTARDVHHVLLEGGGTLAAAFWRAGLVDEVVAYLAPVLLGAGRTSLSDFGITTIDDATRLHIDDVALIGADVRITARPTQRSGAKET